jgi:hypothetical protein
MLRKITWVGIARKLDTLRQRILEIHHPDLPDHWKGSPRRHTALKERECDDRDDEIALLKSKVGEITMDNELLYAKVEVLEGIQPHQ